MMISPTWIPIRNYNSHILRDIDILRGYRALYFHRAAGGIDSAGDPQECRRWSS
jgi:hypothetical protein